MSSYDCLDLCRLCLVKDRVSVPIFEGEGDVRQIFLKITACLPVKVGREDKLPKKICDDCVYKVELLYEFWNTTANAEKQLLQWLGDDGDQDKQGYVSNVMNSELMKQETVENRLDSSGMRTEEHQNNMGMNMMDQMGLTMPIIMSTEQQQITSVPMTSSGNNIQAVPGTSAQSSRGRKSGNNDDDEEESEEEENSDDECDNEEGINVKQENTETGRNVEPSFVNVSIPCDEAGPSGLQQQKMTDMSEIVMAQSAEGDPKSGFHRQRPPKKKPRAGHKCSHCSEIFPHVMKLVEHLKNIHKITNAFSCDECGKTFRSPMNITRHKAIHTGVKKFKCDLCDYSCHQKTNLEFHKKRHMRDYGFKCELCDRGFLFKCELLAHENVHKNIKAHCCELCGAAYTHRKNLMVHMRKHHSRKVNEKVETNSETSIKKNQVLCVTCGMKLSSRSALRAHETIHTGEKNEICDICEKRFATKSGLVVHKRSHTGEKPYNCNQCSKEFSQKTSLVIHLRYHNNDRPYSCKHCGKGFVSGTRLNNHILKVHGNV